MEPVAAPGSRLVFRLILLVSGLHLVAACWYVLFGALNADEGFYALAARSVWQGELPYRDFGYTQMPLLPYINGMMMQLTGFGLFEQRAINGLWGALTLVLAALWLRRRTNVDWALGFVALFSLSAPWMYFVHLGKTYAFTGLVAVAALWVYTEQASGVRKVSTLALLGTLGIGCRLPSAPYFVLLWLAAVPELSLHSRWEWLKAAGLSLLWPVLLIVPFYLAAPDAGVFWTYAFHRISVPSRTWHLPWMAIILLAPSLWLGLVGGGLLIRFWHRSSVRKLLVLVTATLTTLAVNLLPRGAFGEYGIPMLPPLALAVIIALWEAGAVANWLRHAFIPAVLIVSNIVLTVALQWPSLAPELRGTWAMFLPLDVPAFNPRLPESMARARAAVEHSLPQDRPFIGPELILAVETGRNVPNNLRMGGCGTTVDLQTSSARPLQLATLQEVEAYFTDPTVPLLALSKNPTSNYVCSMPSFRNSAQFRSFAWSEFFRQRFRVAYEDDEFLILVRYPGGTPLPSEHPGR